MNHQSFFLYLDKSMTHSGGMDHQHRKTQCPGNQTATKQYREQCCTYRDFNIQTSSKMDGELTLLKRHTHIFSSAHSYASWVLNLRNGRVCRNRESSHRALLRDLLSARTDALRLRGQRPLARKSSFAPGQWPSEGTRPGHLKQSVKWTEMQSVFLKRISLSSNWQ